MFLSGVIFSCDIKATGKDLSERTLIKLREYANMLCDAATEHYDIIMKYSASKVASACVYLARKCCKLSNEWDINLEEYTNIRFS